VIDEAGEPIVYTNLGTGNYVILDVTHPDAAAWLGATIESTVASGYGYLKLDFLYAGAMEGQRAEDVTGIEAYHIGMQIMREAAGDAWILACGAPFLPSLGYAESFRTGADIAFELSPDPSIDYYRWQARSTAARSWTQGRWWWMDPDQLIVREPLSESEVRGALASALVAGGTWMLGDDLTTLDTDRLSLSLDPALTGLLGQQVAPVAPLQWASVVDPSPVIEEVLDDDRVPARWELEDGTVVLLNLGLESIEIEGPGGTNLLTGEQAEAGARALLAGDGEVWRP
jgi:alpha-galactosidase